MRDPKKNPFIPTSPAFWFRTNRYVNGKYLYSTKAGEWGYCQLVESPTAFSTLLLKEMAEEWNQRTYPEEFDPPPQEEIAVKAALVINKQLKESPELIDELDDESIQLMTQLLSEVEIGQNTTIH
ncbi:hypothetical protein [Aeromonas phage ZPAH34]|uniref:hypothetical protein n=1 Tax=Aeromonas phage ZPAH34 TaxID=2924888 RepID=UPI00232957D0|nr:hypothetical protein PQD16_gp118 [Aeromonas phage ZPAH34]UOX39565.1 hypothetical protein [Aeromonas phage ZPAH34]